MAPASRSTSPNRAGPPAPTPARFPSRSRLVTWYAANCCRTATAGPDPFYARGAISGVAPSNRFALSVAPEIAGDPATGTLTFSNPDAVGHSFTVSAGGAETSGSVAAGATATAAVTYPAQESTG